MIVGGAHLLGGVKAITRLLCLLSSVRDTLATTLADESEFDALRGIPMNGNTIISDLYEQLTAPRAACPQTPS